MQQNVYCPKRASVQIPKLGVLTLYTCKDKTFVVLRDIANILSKQKDDTLYDTLFMCGNELGILSTSEDNAPACLLISDIPNLLDALSLITDQYVGRVLALRAYFTPQISSTLDVFSKLTNITGISKSDLCSAILTIRQKKFDDSQQQLQHDLLTTLRKDVVSLAKQAGITPEELNTAILAVKSFYFDKEQQAIYNDFNKH